MAQFVLNEGPIFEAMIMNKELNNPKVCHTMLAYCSNLFSGVLSHPVLSRPILSHPVLSHPVPILFFSYFEGFTSIPTALTANERNRRIQL